MNICREPAAAKTLVKMRHDSLVRADMAPQMGAISEDVLFLTCFVGPRNPSMMMIDVNPSNAVKLNGLVGSQHLCLVSLGLLHIALALGTFHGASMMWFRVHNNFTNCQSFEFQMLMIGSLFISGILSHAQIAPHTYSYCVELYVNW